MRFYKLLLVAPLVLFALTAAAKGPPAGKFLSVSAVEPSLDDAGAIGLYAPVAALAPDSGPTYRLQLRLRLNNRRNSDVVVKTFRTVVTTGSGSVRAESSQGTVIPARGSRVFRLPEFNELAHEPTSLTLEVHLEGFGRPALLDVPIVRQPASYPFFSIAGDLEPDVYWRNSGRWHSQGSHGVQRFAYDVHAVRWNPIRGVFRSAFGDSSKNESRVVWGLPVRAIASGWVTGCAGDHPDNPGPGRGLPACGSNGGVQPCRSLGGGNQVSLLHDDGERSFYAHMRQGSLSPAIYPACRSEDVRVEAGQLLGRIGNSGSSSGPHLHISVSRMPLAFDSAGSIRYNYVEPGDVSAFRDLDAETLGRLAAVHPDCRNRPNEPGRLLVARFDEGGGPAYPVLQASCEESHELDGWFDPGDRHLVGDFTASGATQRLAINNSGFGERVKVLQYWPGASAGEAVHVERWGDSTALNGWHDPNDLLIAGDFMGLGYDQLLTINNAGSNGRLQIVDFSTGAVPAITRYREDWGDSTALDGWHDANDFAFAGDFMGLGYDQLLLINNAGSNGRLQIVDFSSGAVPAITRYREDWGDSTALDGWHNSNDHLLVGDFMGAGYDQMVFINNSGRFGRLKIVDFVDGTVPSNTLHREDWGESTALDGWHNGNDLLLAGDLLGLGRDQAVFINNSGRFGRLKIVDFADGAVPSKTLYREDWGEFDLLDGWHGRNDLVTVGDFVFSDREQIFFLNVD